eukprot:2550552-Rhodomonas_salina.1
MLTRHAGVTRGQTEVRYQSKTFLFPEREQAGMVLRMSAMSDPLLGHHVTDSFCSGADEGCSDKEEERRRKSREGAAAREQEDGRQGVGEEEEERLVGGKTVAKKKGKAAGSNGRGGKKRPGAGQSAYRNQSQETAATPHSSAGTETGGMVIAGAGEGASEAENVQVASAIRLPLPLSAYVCSMFCPVLRYRHRACTAIRLRVQYAMPGTDIGHG